MQPLRDLGHDFDGWRRQVETPLHIAVRANSNDIVTVLIDRGAEIHARSDHGDTPLHYGAWYGSSGSGGERRLPQQDHPH
jgi:hypothetical protein